ncbi:MAG: hypothetical protein R2852_10090 [Bacteroidia bacterium]
MIDVMGMTDLRTDTFKRLTQKFQESIDHDNYESAKKLLDELDTILHPENTLRKLFRLQLASIK